MKNRKATPLANPLAEYAESAPSEVMREVARVALQRNFRQESLARAFAKKTGQNITSGNISRHFESARPHDETINAYAAILGISKDYITLLQRRPFTEKQINTWGTRMGKDIWLHEEFFEPGTPQKILDEFNKLDYAEMGRVLEAYIRGFYTGRWDGSEGWPAAISPGFRALASAMRAKISVKSRLRKNRKLNETYLWDIRTAVKSTGFFDETQVELILNFHRSMLKAKGIDYAFMDEHMRLLDRQFSVAARKEP